MIRVAFARLVPALDEVVLGDADGRADELDVDVVVLPLTVVPRRDHGMRVEIDAPDEGGFSLLAGIDEPGLLMLTEPRVRAIPSDANLVVLLPQQIEVMWSAPKCVALERCCFSVGSPKDDSHINAALGSAVEHFQSGASAIGHSN